MVTETGETESNKVTHNPKRIHHSLIAEQRLLGEQIWYSYSDHSLRLKGQVIVDMFASISKVNNHSIDFPTPALKHLYRL